MHNVPSKFLIEIPRNGLVCTPDKFLIEIMTNGPYVLLLRI